MGRDEPHHTPTVDAARIIPGLMVELYGFRRDREIQIWQIRLYG